MYRNVIKPVICVLLAFGMLDGQYTVDLDNPIYPLWISVEITAGHITINEWST